MGPGQLLVSHLAAALLAVTITGVLIRGRGRLCWTFLLYLVTVLLGNRLTTWWPEQFYNAGFWTLKTTVYTALDWSIALEVALLTFAVAPQARRRALVMMGAVAFAGMAAALLPGPGAGYLHVLSVLAPRGETGALWLLLIVIGLAAWHSMPLHPYHRAIVVGRTLYLTFDVVVLAALGARAGSEEAYTYLAALDPLAFAASVGLWAWAAWRPLEERSGLLGRLQPWASRC